MRYKRFGFAVLAAGLMAGSAFAQDVGSPGPHWGYSGHGAPAHWAELAPDFAPCKLGHAQSPIDIHGVTAKKLAPIAFHYAPAAGEIINNGHTVQVNMDHGGSIGLPSGDYELAQFHFHTPSEETFNGKHYPLATHLVHRSASGELAVVTVLFKLGKENQALKQVFDALPAEIGDKHILGDALDLTTLLPKNHAYYGYTGSLTTPPCTEGVHWQVIKQPVEISKRQLAAFRKLYTMNARPAQAVNGREIDAGG